MPDCSACHTPVSGLANSLSDLGPAGCLSTASLLGVSSENSGTPAERMN